MDEKVLAQIMEQFALLNSRFDKLEQRFDKLEQRFDKLEQRMDSLEHRVGTLEYRFDHLELRFDTLEHRFDQLEMQRADDRKALMETLAIIDQRLDRLEQKIEEMVSWQNDMSVRHRHLVHKVADLEESVAALHAKSA